MRWILIALAAFAAVALILLGRSGALLIAYWWLVALVFLVGMVVGWASFRPSRGATLR